MDVADDIKWAMLCLAIVPEWLSLYGGLVYFLRSREFADMAYAFALKAAQRAPELFALTADNVRAELSIWPRDVPVLAKPFRQVEHDRYREEVVLLCQREESLPRLRLHVRCIDHGEPTAHESPPDDGVKQVKGVARCGLITLIIGDKSAAAVG